MCGHVGFIRKQWKTTGKEDNAISLAMKTLLYVDTLRGDHGTGIQVWKRGWDNGTSSHNIVRHVHKDAIAGHDFINTKQYKEITTVTSSIVAMLGHNRMSTGGAHTIENTHPFISGSVCLQHNGIITNPYLVCGEVVSVDSMSIAKALGSGKEIDDVLNVADGKWCFIWTDLKNTTVHFYRNEHRPLWFAECAYGIFYASEKQFLEFALSRAGIHAEYSELPPFSHVTYTFNYGHLSEHNTENSLWNRTVRNLTIEQTRVKALNYASYSGSRHKKQQYSEWYDESAYNDAKMLPENVRMRDVHVKTRTLSGIASAVTNGHTISPQKVNDRGYESFMETLTKQKWAVGEWVFFCYTDHNGIAKNPAYPNLHNEIWQVSGESAIEKQSDILVSGYARREEIDVATEYKLMLAGRVLSVENISGVIWVELSEIRCSVWQDPMYHLSITA